MIYQRLVNDTIRRLDLDITDGLDYKISPPMQYSKYFPAMYFEMNSADGLQIRWSAKNNTNKVINYYTTAYFMYNAVGDFAYDYLNRNYLVCKTVGPVNVGEWLIDWTKEYEAEVYDVSCDKVCLAAILLEYNDGTSETIYYGHTANKKY